MAAEDEVRVYSYLSPAYIGPVLEAFEADRNIRISVEYLRADDLLQRLGEEKDQPQAELVFTMDAKRLADLTASGTLTPVRSQRLEASIPTHFRHPDGYWFGLSKWTRSVFYSLDRVDPDALTSFHDLADSRWHGKICVRPSNKVYVQTMLAAMLERDGEARVRRFVRGIVANMARSPVDYDIRQISGVAEGVCDLAIANSYYFARLKPASFDVVSGTFGDAKKILDAVAAWNPDAKQGGAHVNISGFARTRSARNPDATLALMEYLVTPAAQRLYADPSGDYPIIKGLEPHDAVKDLGSPDESTLPLHRLARHYALAEKISREEGWQWK